MDILSNILFTFIFFLTKFKVLSKFHSAIRRICDQSYDESLPRPHLLSMTLFTPLTAPGLVFTFPGVQKALHVGSSPGIMFLEIRAGERIYTNLLTLSRGMDEAIVTRVDADMGNLSFPLGVEKDQVSLRQMVLC